MAEEGSARGAKTGVAGAAMRATDEDRRRSARGGGNGGGWPVRHGKLGAALRGVKCDADSQNDEDK